MANGSASEEKWETERSNMRFEARESIRNPYRRRKSRKKKQEKKRKKEALLKNE